MLKKILLISLILIIGLSIFGCTSPTKEMIYESQIQQTIKDANTNIPIYYSNYTGRKLYRSGVPSATVRYDTQDGTLYATVISSIDCGFFSKTDESKRLALFYNETTIITHDMLNHPENFHWVIQNP